MCIRDRGSTAGRRKGIEQDTESWQCRENTGKEEKGKYIEESREQTK